MRPSNWKFERSKRCEPLGVQECCMQMLAGQLKHLVKQTEMKRLLSFHSDKNKLCWWRSVCVNACICYVIWQRRGVPVVSGDRLDFWVSVWTHSTPAATHRYVHTRTQLMGFSAGIHESHIWGTQIEEQQHFARRMLVLLMHMHTHNHHKELIPPLSHTHTHTHSHTLMATGNVPGVIIESLPPDYNW